MEDLDYKDFLGYALLAIIIYLVWKHHGQKSRNSVTPGTEIAKAKNAVTGSAATAGDSFTSGCSLVSGVCEKSPINDVSCDHLNAAHFPVCSVPPPFSIMRNPAPVVTAPVPVAKPPVARMPVRSHCNVAPVTPVWLRRLAVGRRTYCQ